MSKSHLLVGIFSSILEMYPSKFNSSVLKLVKSSWQFTSIYIYIYIYIRRKFDKEFEPGVWQQVMMGDSHFVGGKIQEFPTDSCKALNLSEGNHHTFEWCTLNKQLLHKSIFKKGLVQEKSMLCSMHVSSHTCEIFLSVAMQFWPNRKTVNVLPRFVCPYVRLPETFEVRIFFPSSIIFHKDSRPHHHPNLTSSLVSITILHILIIGHLLQQIRRCSTITTTTTTTKEAAPAAPA